MKKNYLINIDNYSTIENDINIFIKELELLDTIGYVLPHFLNTYNEITSYGAIVIEVEGEVNLEYLKEIYNIIPNKVYRKGDTRHVVFELYTGTGKRDYIKAGNTLEFILDGKHIDYYYFPEYKIIKEFENESIDKNLLIFLRQLNLQLNNKKNIERYFSKTNYSNFIKANEISFTDIFTKLKLPLVDFDPKKNIHLKYGYPFSFVENHYGSQKKAFEFFNKYFELEFEFEGEEETGKYTKDGVLIQEGDKFFKGGKFTGYYTQNKDGDSKVITDFLIKVYYKIRHIDGTFNYIVSLINGDGYETEKLKWYNGTGRTGFGDFIQRQGNFHFTGGDLEIKQLHKEISSVNHIPFIKNIVGYGYQKEDEIIIFNNGVWDIKERVFTAKEQGEKYYFNYNYKGYSVVDKQANDLAMIIKDGIPNLDTSKVVNLDELFDFVNSLYEDDTGLFLVFIAFGMFGYLLYGNQDEPFPFLFAKGITASGKTSFNNLLARIWGIKKSGTDFGTATLFSMTVMFSYLIKFPYFLGEYRRNILHADAKEGILRSVFDRKSQPKGRADQTVITYEYFANPIMDGEEIMTDGAVKSRTIQRKFIKAHRIKGNFEQIVSEKGEMLDHLMFTYLLNSDKKRYDEGFKEGRKIFHEMTKDSNSRIGDNFAKIYAGCYSMSDKYKYKYLEVLKKSCEYQSKDFVEDGTSMQIIKAITKFLENNAFGAVEVVGNNVIILWNKLDEYIRRYRVSLSLDVETYKDHIESLGYNIGYLDADDKMLYGVIIPNNKIPKQFLIHPDFYSANKKYLALKK